VTNIRVALKTKTGTASARWVMLDVTTSNAFATTTNNLSLDLEGAGAYPYLAITGDSIAEGHNLWHSQYHAGIDGTLANYLLYYLRGLISDDADEGFEWQNFGKGSEDYSEILVTGYPAALASGAKVILVHCGINDIAGARTWAAVEADLDAIKVLFDASATAEKLVINEILPWTAGDDTQAGTVRTFNDNLATWCTANGATLVPCHDAMGQTRVSTGELDDLITAYDADGVHLTAAGQSALAALVEPYVYINRDRRGSVSQLGRRNHAARATSRPATK